MSVVTQSEALFLETVQRFLTIYRYLRQYGRQLQGQDLSGREVSILRHLQDSGSLTISQCRQYLYISDSSTSELIAHLEKDGYVTRNRSQSDNRSVVVSLTDLGTKTARALAPGGIPLLRERLKTVSQERLCRINEALSDIQELLEITDEK